MPTYIRVPIETNPETLAQDIFNYIQSQEPNWTPADGNLDVWIIRAIAAKAAENRDLASDVPDTIFSTLGAKLFLIPPTDAVAATANTTWTVSDTLGHTIPAGTYVGIRNSVGDLITFATTADVVIAPGASETTVGEVVIQATTPGIEGNNLSGGVDLIDVLDWVETITLVSATGGGVDAEDNDTYMNRLVRRLARLSQTPILAPEYALAALDADPGVYRAVALDTYDPDTDTYDNDRTVTVAAVDINGNAVSSAIKTNIENYINTRREQNFVFKTMDPNYTTIDVTSSIKVLTGYDATSTEDAAEAAINNYLAKSNWGVDPISADPQSWIEQETLYYNELIALVSNVEGVDRVVSLTVNKSGDTPATTDVALTAPASLTVPGTISVTAV